jgi:hypothetical protein
MQRPGQVLKNLTGHPRRALGRQQCPARSTGAPSIIGLVGRPGNHRPIVAHTTAYDSEVPARGQRIPADTSATKRPWSVQDRIDERTRADMIAAYRAGTTAASLATTHGLSLRSVKRLLTSAGVHRKQLPA